MCLISTIEYYSLSPQFTFNLYFMVSGGRPLSGTSFRRRHHACGITGIRSAQPCSHWHRLRIRPDWPRGFDHPQSYYLFGFLRHEQCRWKSCSITWSRYLRGVYHAYVGLFMNQMNIISIYAFLPRGARGISVGVFIVEWLTSCVMYTSVDII